MPMHLKVWNYKLYSSVENAILSLIQEVSNMNELKQTHALITKTGLGDHTIVICKLITFTALSSFGSLDYAQSVFERVATKEPFVFNTMIRAYSHSAFPMEAIYLYNHMQQKNVKSDHYTYPFLLKACARVCATEDHKLVFVKKGSELHGRIIQLGMDSDSFVQNALIFMYSQTQRLDLARCVFDHMAEKTIISWNTMIVAYNRSRDFLSANMLLEKIPKKNVVSWNTMITRYVQSGDIEAAWRVFKAMPERDPASWNSMIAGYIQSRNYSSAFQLFHQMQVSGISPNEVTIISILGAYAETGELEKGEEVHRFLKWNNFKIEGILGTALLDMYGKCGNLNLAREVFDGMCSRHISSWNSMIVALAVHGYSEEAIELFKSIEKKESRVCPNRVTFIGLLIACSHKGLVTEGHYYFNKMVEEYKIIPDIKHYGCMVDLLSRWGLLDEAHEMIKTMPITANGVLWRTLLGACRVHGNVELAEEVIRKLGELEPLRDGDYVLLSNIYAEAGHWEDVEQVRNKMIDWGVLKKTGCSQIAVK